MKLVFTTEDTESDWESDWYITPGRGDLIRNPKTGDWYKITERRFDIEKTTIYFCCELSEKSDELKKFEIDGLAESVEGAQGLRREDTFE